jgi:hypothetical protein
MVFRGFMRWSAKMDYHNIDEKRFDSPNLKEVSNRSILVFRLILLISGVFLLLQDRIIRHIKKNR